MDIGKTHSYKGHSFGFYYALQILRKVAIVVDGFS